MLLSMPCELPPSMPSLHLAHAIQVASRFVGRRIDAMETVGIIYPEVAATADFLHTIQSVAPLFTRVIQVRMNEAKTGADFEWWIGAGPLWLGLRIQAKRHFRHHTAGHRDYYGDIGKVNKNGAQVDLLIADCAKRGRVPLHMFFESASHASPTRTAKCGNDLPGDLWGASVADSHEIKRLVAAGTLAGTNVRTVLQPAACLPVCGGTSGALVDRTMSAIRERVWSRDRVNSPFPEPGPLPRYVARLLTGGESRVPDLPYGLDALLVTSEEIIGNF